MRRDQFLANVLEGIVRAEILRLWRSGLSQVEIAERFDVTEYHVRKSLASHK